MQEKAPLEEISRSDEVLYIQSEYIYTLKPWHADPRNKTCIRQQASLLSYIILTLIALMTKEKFPHLCDFARSLSESPVDYVGMAPTRNICNT